MRSRGRSTAPRSNVIPPLERAAAALDLALDLAVVFAVGADHSEQLGRDELALSPRIVASSWRRGAPAASRRPPSVPFVARRRDRRALDAVARERRGDEAGRLHLLDEARERLGGVLAA